ncbi:hypothetical protein STEG23_038023, partial [Scotinomys teguina]
MDPFHLDLWNNEASSGEAAVAVDIGAKVFQAALGENHNTSVLDPAANLHSHFQKSFCYVGLVCTVSDGPLNHSKVSQELENTGVEQGTGCSVSIKSKYSTVSRKRNPSSGTMSYICPSSDRASVGYNLGLAQNLRTRESG